MVLAAYRRILCRYPILIQSVQTGMLMATGDLLAQTYLDEGTEKEKSVDYERTLRFAFMGTFIVGPSSSLWYRILQNYVKGNEKGVAIKKVILDQFVFCPVFLVIFLTVLGTIQRKPFEAIKDELNNVYVDILIANYKVWPLVQLLNFYFIPLNYQVLLVQAVALGWNCYLSWKVHHYK